MGTVLKVGYVPLVDAAPLVIAAEMQFARDEGLTLELRRQPSWSAVRDLLSVGYLDLAHMLSPMPIAMSLGLAGVKVPVDALMVLSVNGNAIGTSNALADRMRDAGWGGRFQTPVETGRALIDASQRLPRIGVPFPFSMHAELVHYWLENLGFAAPSLEIIPPPLMAEAIAADEIDAFCVGEPWGSIAVEDRVGELILPGSAIWGFAPEKVLGARRDWIEANPTAAAALMRAVSRAAQWLDAPENRTIAAEVLARSEFLDVSDHVIDRSLAGRLVPHSRSFPVAVPNFQRFHIGAANFPWRSQGEWIAMQLAKRYNQDSALARKVGKACFRADLYRKNLAGTGLDMPGASEKLEGALHERTSVASEYGRVILEPDAFFDGKTYDPA